MRTSKVNVLLFLFLVTFYVDASAAEAIKSSSKIVKVEEVERHIDPVKYSRGRKLFLLNCAKCHGKQGEGAKEWRKPDINGKNLPPPLNGTGHTWHHPRKALVTTIKNGTGKIGGNMPAWKDQLSDEDIDAILSYITAQWPDEIYTSWYNRSHQ